MAPTQPEKRSAVPTSSDDSEPVRPKRKRRSPEKRSYHCARCGKQLKDQRWIYSKHTKARYCWPGEKGGCNR